ncbi:MAG: DUF1592 domain-containing protein [Vicinamibacterales bacterium]
MTKVVLATLGATVVAMGLAVSAPLVSASTVPPVLPAARPVAPPPVAPVPAAARPAISHETTAPEAAQAPAGEVARMDAAHQNELINQYCGAACHSARAHAGGLSLADFNAGAAYDQPEVVEKVIRKLRAGMMPPVGAKRPEPEAIASLVASLEHTVDTHAARTPNPGYRPFQRLNRAEYGRAVQDLFGIKVDVTEFLPADTISQGFDNVADAQTFSPTLLEGYLRAASRVSALAIGDRDAPASETNYKPSKTASQLERVEGAPIGTRGGLSTMHVFPADGEYVFRMDLHSNACGVLFGGTAENEALEVSIDGERVALLPIDPKMTEATTGITLTTEPIRIVAGTHRVTAAFLKRAAGPVLDIIAPIEQTLADTQIGVAYGITTVPHLKDLSIVGPYRVTGISDTESRRRIFTCRPTSRDEEAACAASIVKRLATNAFRGTPDTWDFENLMSFYEAGRKAGDFEDGIGAAIEAILTSPQFLFRFEPVPSSATAGQAYRLSDQALAARLSYFLWDAAPDAQLREAAASGALRKPAGLHAEVRRLLADPRAEALATRFASQWLRLQDVDQILPDALLYPYFDRTLGNAFKRETELLFYSLVREDRSILDLLTADYTFVNERLARHYGIAGVSGPQYRRVTVPDERRGILGQGSILTLTSVADRTSPVMRGKWVMEVLLGSPPPPPPPNVPALDDSVKANTGGRMLSVRERMEQHRANPACASCHRVIDPIGLALEHFDVTGKWRIKDNGVPIDSVGNLYDGTKMEGSAGLRAALLKHKDAFLLAFTENFMTYALGRRIEAEDMPWVRDVIHKAADDDYKLSAFVLAVVDSPTFQMKSAATVETAANGNDR